MSELMESFREEATASGYVVEPLDDLVVSVTPQDAPDGPHTIVTFDEEDEQYVSCSIFLFDEEDLKPVGEEAHINEEDFLNEDDEITNPEIAAKMFRSYVEALKERIELQDVLMEATIVTPLSSIGKIDSSYLLNGQLIARSPRDIIDEIDFLNRNYLFVLRKVRNFLCKRV